MILIAGLIGLGILLDLIFVWDLWPPWRSSEPGTAWILSSIAFTVALFETFVLLATYDIPVPALLALVVLLGKDAALVWRMVKVRRSRQEADRSEC